jgi:hypothetical protein
MNVSGVMAKCQWQGGSWLLALLLLYAHGLGGGGFYTIYAEGAVMVSGAAECSLRELRCELLCQYAEMQTQCDACRSRRPLRFGKRDPVLAPPYRIGSGIATKSSSDRLAVTVTTSREAPIKSLPLARVQLLLPERDNPYAKEQPCYCCNPLSLACLLYLS